MAMRWRKVRDVAEATGIVLLILGTLTVLIYGFMIT